METDKSKDEDVISELAKKLDVRYAAQIPEGNFSPKVRNLSEHLILAVTCGWPAEKIKDLLAQGADPTFSNRKGVSPLSLAHSKKIHAENDEIRARYEVIEKVLERKSDNHPKVKKR
ncbi:MAG: hypothetical protein U1E78_05750 [Gammaproteobacteria bacterium]